MSGIEELRRALAGGWSTATEMFGAYSGLPVYVEITSAGFRDLTVEKHRELRGGTATQCYERHGFLRTPSGPVAETSLSVLRERMPDDACTQLGIPRPGKPAPRRTRIPFGEALRDLGVRRESPTAVLLAGRCDAAGEEYAILSSAVMWLGGEPIGMATELVYRRFCEDGPAETWPEWLRQADPQYRDYSNSAVSRLQQ